jgi:hypothetical protein
MDNVEKRTRVAPAVSFLDSDAIRMPADGYDPGITNPVDG